MGRLENTACAHAAVAVVHCLGQCGNGAMLREGEGRGGEGRGGGGESRLVCAVNLIFDLCV